MLLRHYSWFYCFLRHFSGVVGFWSAAVFSAELIETEGDLFSYTSNEAAERARPVYIGSTVKTAQGEGSQAGSKTTISASQLFIRIYPSEDKDLLPRLLRNYQLALVRTLDRNLYLVTCASLCTAENRTVLTLIQALQQELGVEQVYADTARRVRLR